MKSTRLAARLSLALCASQLAACHEEPAPLAIELSTPVQLADRHANPPLVAPEWHTGAGLAFAPANATTPAGTWQAFDRAGDDGVFDIVLVAPDGRTRTIAERPTHQTSAALAAGPAGRLWLAFEEGGPEWGRGANLRRTRRIVFGEVATDGGFTELEAPRWVPATSLATGAEAPGLAVDGRGRPWLFARTLRSWKPIGKVDEDGTAANRRAAWSVHAAVLTDRGWSPAVSLPRSDGPEDGALELEPTEAGVRARAFTDNRIARILRPELTGPWFSALPGEGAWFELELTLATGAAPASTPADPSPWPSTEPQTPNPNRKYTGPALPTGMQLLWGDLHRHTDASRCKTNEDSDLADAYRYALGTAGLDFLCVTDHFQHMTPATLEREEESADAFDALPGFVAFPGYERALPKGHWTLVANPGPDSAPLADAAFAPYRPRFLWDDHDPATWLAIPHQITDRTAPLTWDATGTDLDPVIELYQSRRGSYESRSGWLRDLGGNPEAPWADDYLSEGRLFGVTASSDHATTDGAFTAVLIPDDVEPSRAAILSALRARRCYAATAPIGLDFELVSGSTRFPMGSEVPAAELGAEAAIEIVIDARRLPGGELRSVELIRGSRGVAGRPVEAWADFENDGRLLTVRIGRAERNLELTLRGEGEVAFEEPTALGLEASDSLGLVDGAPTLAATIDPRDVDGFTVEVRAGAGAILVLEAQNEKRTTEAHFSFAELEKSPSEIFWTLGARTSVRLDSLGIGLAHGTLETRVPGLEPGDWLYVRVVTSSGDAAWSSPIFVR
jgi:hypothetical protein